MAYEFKNLNEVESLASPTENTTIMGFENGVPVQMPASELGGKGLIFEIAADEYTIEDDNSFTVTKSYDPLYEALSEGRTAYIKLYFPEDAGAPVEYCCINPILWMVLPNEGFSTACFVENSIVSFLFSNGSYHGATETANTEATE